MFERFTNRARHVVVLAQEEARLLDHNYIGTEHILLGLLGESESIGGKVLADFGFTREGGREEVERRVGRGKSFPSGHVPFTPRAKKILELSLREALSLGHNYIGTEHILLGLIREGEGVAYQILCERTNLGTLRAAVIDAIPMTASPEGEGDAPDETNAVLRWLRARLTRHSASVPFRPEAMTAEAGLTRGTPAVEAALQQAATLAGALPVGSHHLLLAALNDTDSAASSALSSLGVDLDELREKLRSANLAGTSDELPQEAGRRQMTIEVSDEMLTIVLTDPVIVKAGKDALRFGNAGQAGTGEAEDGEPATGESASPAATSRVIRGDHPAAAGLADVWVELRKTLATLAGVPAPPPRRRTRVVRHPGSSKLIAESAADHPDIADPATDTLAPDDPRGEAASS
ncbi:Clp protease [Trebonia kvetii]|uniref:Clp protease n=2 Tax=Trebonia kvetii TaxID=2480626 RepID=A0A6P2C6B0_9ACTN|nr:Clp protease [Trebonia kvetii]